MSNYLKVGMRDVIKKLVDSGMSQRAVSRKLGLNRRTVRKYSCAENAECTISAVGSASRSASSKCTIPTVGRAGRKSLCQKHHAFIEKGVEAGFSAQRIYQDLKELDFDGSYESVKRYVRQIKDKLELPFRRMETEPGFEVQIDYGTGAWICSRDGKRRKTHLFRIVLSHSRKGYSEVSFRQDTDSFIRAIENAFIYFGGVPRTIVIDNLKAGVIKPCVYDPELNPKLKAFAEHYGTCVLPSRVGTPRHKGKVESSVKYVQNNALKGRKFNSLNEQNDYLLHWEKTVADTRIHGTVRKQVAAMFEQEKDNLMQLPETLFPVFDEVKRKVHRDGHIELRSSFYSVPPEYIRREVWVRYNLRTVEIFNKGMKQIALHARVEPGRFSTHSYHIPPEKISNPERGNSWLLRKLDMLGTDTGAWARAVLKNRGIPGTRVLNGLLQLTDKHTASSINTACKKALDCEVFRLKELKELIKRSDSSQQMKFSFLEEHPLIRNISEYGRMSGSTEVFQ